MLRRQKQEPDRPRVGRVRQAGLEGPECGPAPGRIAVEAEDHRVGEPEQLLHVVGGAGGAERCDAVLEAGLRQRDDVHVALDHEGVAALAQGRARFEQAVELAALDEDRRFRGVQVLGFAAVEDATAEADDVALDRADRKHDAVAESVVALALRFVGGVGLLHDHHAALFEQRVVVRREHARQAAPAVRRIAEAEPGRDFSAQAAALQIVDRPRALLELATVMRGGPGQDVGERDPSLLLGGGQFAIRHRPVVVGHGQADLLRQILDRIDERHAVLLDEEADRIAVRSAAEAVIELLRRGDGEARRLLGVKRAQPAEVDPALLQLDLPADDVDDVDACQEFLDEGGRDHPISLRRDQCTDDSRSEQNARSGSRDARSDIAGRSAIRPRSPSVFVRRRAPPSAIWAAIHARSKNLRWRDCDIWRRLSCRYRLLAWRLSVARDRRGVRPYSDISVRIFSIASPLSFFLVASIC